MMRLDDSREAGLLNPSTQYASLETSMRMSEFDVPMRSRRPKSLSRCFVASVCITLVAVAAIVSVSVGKAKGNAPGDESESPQMRNSPQRNMAPAPSPEVVDTPGAFVASAPPAPPVGISEPVSAPLAASPPIPPPRSAPPSQSAPPSDGAPPLAALAPSPSSSSSSYHLVLYDTICNKTVDPVVCLNLFASNPNSPKVDFQQWTIMTMQAAEQALNESYTVAMTLKHANDENVALEQCIDVFSEALVLVNESMYALANMDVHNPGDPGADIQVALNAAMTDHDTCQDGIDDVGPFPGSDRITGVQARHVDTLLSISLTFFNELIATSEDPNHHRRRRLLHVASAAAVGRRGLLATRDSLALAPGRTLS